MIDLGKSKEVTAVLNLKTQFSPKKDFFRIFNIAFRFQDISNDICHHTTCTFSGLKLHSR